MVYPETAQRIGKKRIINEIFDLARSIGRIPLEPELRDAKPEVHEAIVNGNYDLLCILPRLKAGVSWSKASRKPPVSYPPLKSGGFKRRLPLIIN